MAQVIHTYFEDLYDYSKEVLTIFVRSWETHGFEVMVHTMHQAMAHKDYESFMSAVDKYPTTNDPNYERCCYRRWLAYATSAFGDPSHSELFLDYDIINYGIRKIPETVWPVLSLWKAAAVKFDKPNLDKFIHSIMAFPEWQWDSKHNSDMTILIHYFRIPRDPWTIQVNEYTDPVLNELVHYGSTNGKRTLCSK